MPNVFADTHDPPLRPPVRPAPGFGINHGRQLLSDLRTATGAHLDALAHDAGLRRWTNVQETDGELRARLINVYADHLQTRLDVSRALVARVRAAIGARAGESTDGALARLDAEIMPARDAVGARTGESLAVAARRAVRCAALDLEEVRATLDAVKHAVGLPLTTPASEVAEFFRRFEADVEGAIAPTQREEHEPLGAAIRRHHATLEGIVRGVRAAIGAPEGADLVDAVRRLRGSADRLSKIRAALES